MARPLKDRRWTEPEQALNWAHSLADQRPLFDGLMLSNLTITALVIWIRQKNPKAARFLMQKIRTLTAMERCLQVDAQLVPSLSLPPLPPSGLTINVDDLLRRGVYGESLVPSERSMVNELMVHLRGIAKANVPKARHDWREVPAQRMWLTEYIKSHPFPSSYTPHECKTWVTLHAEPLYRGLTSFECHCEYRASICGITTKALTNCTGAADLICILISHLHDKLKPSVVRKHLSHPRRR